MGKTPPYFLVFNFYLLTPFSYMGKGLTIIYRDTHIYKQ